MLTQKFIPCLPITPGPAVWYTVGSVSSGPPKSWETSMLCINATSGCFPTLISTLQERGQSFPALKALCHEILVRANDDEQPLARGIEYRKHLENVIPRTAPHEREPGTRFNDDKLQLAGSDRSHQRGETGCKSFGALFGANRKHAEVVASRKVYAL